MQKAKDIYKNTPLSLDLYEDIKYFIRKFNKGLPKTISIGRMVLDFNLPKMEEKEDFLEKMSGIDNILFRRLKKSGHLQSIPATINTMIDVGFSYNRVKYGTYVLSNHLRKKDIIHLSTASDGFINDLRDQSIGKKNKIFARWMVLLHEAAHSELHKIDNIFRPSNVDIDKKDLQYINDTSFSDTQNATIYKQAHEAFADVYGTIMALEASGYDKDMIEEVKALKKIRQKDLDYITSRYGSLYAAETNSYFYTSKSLDVLMENIDYIKTLNVDEQKNKALEITSNVIAHHLINNKQTNILKHNSYKDYPGSYYSYVSGAFTSYLRGEDYTKGFKILENKPDYDVLKEVVTQAVEYLKNTDKLELQEMRQYVINNDYKSLDKKIINKYADFINERVSPLNANFYIQKIARFSYDYVSKEEYKSNLETMKDDPHYEKFVELWMEMKDHIDNMPIEKKNKAKEHIRIGNVTSFDFNADINYIINQNIYNNEPKVFQMYKDYMKNYLENIDDVVDRFKKLEVEDQFIKIDPNQNLADKSAAYKI